MGDSSQRFCEQCGAPVEAGAVAAPAGMPTPAGLPQIGSVVAGRYRIVRLIGEGGMGCVYAAEQALGTTARKVALKTLHLELSQNEAIRARFEREVATVAKLEHPNTIQVYDFGSTDSGMLYIVMELAVGRSLADVLETEGAVDPQRAVKILTQIAGSLEEAHSHGIIHRDLKPENVMLIDRAGQKDFVKVLDFGIAKNRDEEAQGRKLTQAGTVLGTPPYMSPEQFSGQALGPQSDIYSLGVMAFELLTGKLPFQAAHAWEWATLHMTTPPKTFDEFPRGAQVPQTIRDAVYRALRKAPEERFARVSDFAEALVHTTSPRVLPTAEGQLRAPRVEAPVLQEPTPPPVSPPRPGGTVMGAPLEAAIGAPGGTFHAPPIQEPPYPQHVQHARYPEAHHAPVGAYVAPAVHHAPARKRGGSMGLILGLLGVCALLGIGAAVVVAAPWEGTTTPKPVLVDTNVAPTPPPASTPASNSDPSSSSGGLSVLNDPKVNPTPPPGPGPGPGPGPKPQAQDAGVKPNPTPVPTPSTPPAPVPTPKPTTPPPPPLVLPTVWPPITPVTPPAGQTPAACNLAANARGKNPAQYEKFKAECLAKGGRVPGE
ncbi:MAG: serine/threonine-protein kinase [Polyangiaceae bacterium]